MWYLAAYLAGLISGGSAYYFWSKEPEKTETELALESPVQHRKVWD